MTDGTILLRPSGAIRDADRNACRIVGRSAAELSGTSLKDLFAAADRRRFSALWRSKGPAGMQRTSVSIVAADGSVRSVELGCTPDPESGLIICSLRDHTERQRTLSSVQEAEQRLRMFIENSAEGIWCFALDRPMRTSLPVRKQIDWFMRYGYLLECNDAYAQMYGFTGAAEIAGARLTDIMDKDDPKNIAYFTNFIRGGYRLRDTETNERDRHGRVFTVVNNVTGTVVNGRLINAWGTQRDITAALIAQQAVKESELRYRNLISNLNEGIWVIDRDAKTTLVNPRMAEMVGTTTDAMIGRPLFEFIRQEDFERTKSSLKRREEGVRETREYTFIHPDGSRVHTTIETYPLMDAGGAYLGAVAAFTDVTEQYEAEQRLRRQNEQHRFLAEASARLAGCSAENDVYRLIAEMLNGLVPDSVVFVLKTAPDGSTSTLMEISGIDDSIIMTGARLLRYDPKGRTFHNKKGFAERFINPTLRFFHGGLHEASDGVVPKFVSRRIERLLGVSHYYCIGISDADHYFGYLHIMTREALTVESSSIEAFVHQCFMALTKIRSVRTVEEEAARRRFFFESSVDGICIMDVERRIIEVNRTFAAMHGYTREEIVGLHSWQISAEVASQKEMERWFPRLPDQNMTIETRHRRKDGSEFDVEVSFSVVVWNNDTRVSCLCRDITERKRAAALIEQEALRRTMLMNASHDGIAIIDQNHAVVECNPRFAEMLGYTAKEVLALHTWDWEARFTEQQIRESFSDLAAVHRTFETVHRRKDGTTYEAEVSASGTMVGGQKLVITISRDISGRKQLEREIEQRGAQYRQLMDSVPQSIFVKDTSSVYRTCNAVYAADLGMTPESIAGHTDFDFFPRELAEQYRADDRVVLTTGAMLEREESYVSNGLRKEIFTTKVPLKDQNGAITGVLGIFSDITERKRLERTIREQDLRYQRLFSMMMHGVVYQDAEGRILSANDAAQRILGLTMEQMQGVTSLDPRWRSIREDGSPFPGGDHPAMLALRTGKEVSNVVMGVFNPRKESVVWIRINAYPLRDAETGPATGVFATFEDITVLYETEKQKERSAEQSRQSAESYRGLFNSVQDAIYIQNEQGVFLDVNSAAEVMYGYTREEMIGKTPEFVAAPGKNDHLDFPVILRSVMRGASQQFEFWGRRRNGEIFPKDVRLTKGMYFGKPVIIALAQDITARKHTEEERERRINELTQLFTLTQHTSGDIGEERILQIAAETLCRALRCPKSAVLLFDDAGVMRFRASVGLSERYRASAEGHSPWTVHVVNPSPVFVEDVEQEPSLDHLRASILSEQIRSLGFIPLMHNSRLIGKFMVYFEQVHRFTQHEVRLVQTIAQTIAGAVARVRGSDALARNEEILRTIFASVEEGIALNELVHDEYGEVVDYRILEVNDAFEKIAALPRAKVVGRLATEIYQMPKEYITAFWKEHRHATAPIKSDLYSDLAKSWKHVSTSVPVNGRFVTSFFDITEIKQTEQSLHSSNAMLQSLIQSQTNYLVRTDLAGAYTFVNDQFCRAFGYRKEELIGTDARATFVNSDAPAVETAVMRCLENPGTSVPVQIRKLHPLHGIAVTDWEFIAITDESGAPIEIQCVGHDVTEKMRALQEIRTNEERYRTVANFTYDWEMWTAPDGTIEYISPSCEHFSGYTADEFAADPALLQSIIHPDDRQLYDRHHTAELSNGEHEELVFRIITRGGEERCVHHICRSIHAKDGRYLGRRISNRDITDQKRRELQLRASEERYRTIVENIHQAYYESDVKGRFTYVNPGLVILSGFAEEELLGTLSFRIVADDDLRLVKTTYQQWMKERRRKMALEFRVKTREGRVFWVEQTSHFEFDELGRFVKAINFVRDIAERKEAEDLLRQSEEQNRALIGSIPDIMFVMDGSGRFVEIHVPDTEHLLVPPETMIGRSMDDLIREFPEHTVFPFVLHSPEMPGPVRDRAGVERFVNDVVKQRLTAALEPDAPAVFYKYAIESAAGYQYFEAQVVSFGQNRVLHIVRNVTDKIKHENMLRSMNEELERRVDKRTAQLTEANKELEAFSYSVSHDLRAPLRAIDSFSAMLLEGYEEKFDDEGRRLIGVVRASIKRMDLLINGLLTLSRIGRDTLHHTEIDMRWLAQSLIEEHLPADQRPRYTVSIGPLPPCQADAALLRQAFGNLISNAVKYSSATPSPAVEITGSMEEGMCIYKVKDNGVGFDPANANKLFGIFQRLHTSEQFAGLGIGLSIVQRIIHRHGGRVWANGTLNGGAEFFFSLPVTGVGGNHE